MRRLIFIVCFFSLLLPRGAAAHANLVASTPAPNVVIAQAPATAELRFSEPLESAYSRVLLMGADAGPAGATSSRIDPSDPAVLLLDLPSLRPGRYALEWRTLSQVDGHMAEGSVPFTIGDPASTSTPLLLPPATDPLKPPPLVDILLRWLTQIGVALLVGSVIFGGYVWRPTPDGARLVEPRFVSWTRRLERGAVLVALLGSLGALVATSIRGLTPVTELVTSTRTGAVLAMRVVLVVALGTVVWRSPGRFRFPIALALGCATLLSLSLLSHSALPRGKALEETSLTGVSIGFDWLHLLACAAWLGGLPPLLGALRALRSIDKQGLAAALIVARFTALATASVITLAATGTYAALQHVMSLSQLWTTAYGRALTLKLALFGLLLLLGGYNRWHVYPRLLTLTDGDDPGMQPRALLRRLRLSMDVELAAGALLLLAVAVLTAAAPARDMAGHGAPQFANVGDLRLGLQVAPDVAGDLFALDVGGLVQGSRANVVLRMSMPAHHTDEQELTLVAIEPGRWAARGMMFTMPGLWNVTAIVRVPGRNDVRHTFTVDTTPLPTTPAGPGSRLPWSEMLVAAALLMAVGQLRRDTQRRGRTTTEGLAGVVTTYAD